MLAVDRLRKSVSSSSGLPRQQSTMTSTPLQSPAIPAVEPRTSSLVRKPSNSRSTTVNGPSTPGRYAQPFTANATATATEIIHLRDDPVVVQPEVVAIQVSRSSSTWTTAANSVDDDDVIGGGVSSSLTYESFRGPPTIPHSPPLAAVDVVTECRRDRVDDGDRTPTNEVDDTEVSSQHDNRGDVVMMNVTVAASSPSTSAQVPSVASAASVKVPVTSSLTTLTSTNQAPTCQASTSQVPSVTSPLSPQPRPQIAPKPRLDLRRRRASAGESTTTVDHDNQGVVAVTSPTSKTGRIDVTGQTSPLSSTPGLAMLASVMAAASSQRMSERCRSPQSPSSARRSAADTQVDRDTSAVSVSNCARPSSASALSRTALNGNGSDLGSAGGSQPLRTHSKTGVSSSLSVGTDKKTQGKDDKVRSPSRTTSTGDSPRRSSSTVPPPVPPKHTNSFKVEKRSPDTDVQSRVVARSLSSGNSAAAATMHGLSAGSSAGPSDTGTLPFANENVGTIRQRGAVVSVEQPTDSATSVNDDVTTTAGNSFTCTVLPLVYLKFGFSVVFRSCI